MEKEKIIKGLKNDVAFLFQGVENDTDYAFDFYQSLNALKELVQNHPTDLIKWIDEYICDTERFMYEHNICPECGTQMDVADVKVDWDVAPNGRAYVVSESFTMECPQCHHVEQER